MHAPEHGELDERWATAWLVMMKYPEILRFNVRFKVSYDEYRKF
jgi:hypothetical protein